MRDTAGELFHEKEERALCATDRILAWLLLLQWAALVALPASRGRLDLAGPCALAGAVAASPLLALLLRPGSATGRGLTAIAQALWSVLFAWIEQRLPAPWLHAEAHPFVSLAFLAFYRDWRVLLAGLSATLAGGLLLAPLSGAHWLFIEALLLAEGARRARRERREDAAREASLQQLSQSVEERVLAKTAELEASRERYKALVEGSHALPWELDPATFRFTYLSPRITELTGLDPIDPGCSERLWELVHKGDRARVRRSLRELSSGENVGTLDFECRMTGAKGEALHVRSRVSRGASGLLLGTSFDATKTKRLEIELRSAQRLESVGRLAAGVAHEINTPVQFVSDSVHFVRDAMPEILTLLSRYRSLAGALRGPSLESSAAEVLDAIERAEAEMDLPYLEQRLPSALDRALDGLTRIASIVRSMGAFARSDRVEMAPVDLNRAIEDTLVIARNEYKYVADVHLDLAPLPPVTCSGGDMNQVLLNLVINAAHAVKAKGERGRIDIRTRQEGEEVLISVSDTGTGISPDVRDRIFEPFFTTKKLGQGTGQGLAIARAVVAGKHSGQLGFTTRTGEGSTFVIRLPIRPPPPSRSAA